MGGTITFARASASAGSTTRSQEQPSEPLPERPEPRRKTRHAARPRPDRVVDDLLAERNAEVDRRSTLPRRNRDEAVQVDRFPPVPVDRVPAAEEPRHHRLGHARGEAGRDGRVGGGAALLEDLDPGRDRRRMPRCDGRLHRAGL